MTGTYKLYKAIHKNKIVDAIYIVTEDAEVLQRLGTDCSYPVGGVINYLHDFYYVYPISSFKQQLKELL